MKRRKRLKYMYCKNDSNLNGFIKGKSCLTQLIEFIEEFRQAIDDGDNVDVIYLDFKKRFWKSST